MTYGRTRDVLTPLSSAKKSESKASHPKKLQVGGSVAPRYIKGNILDLEGH